MITISELQYELGTAVTVDGQKTGYVEGWEPSKEKCTTRVFEFKKENKKLNKMKFITKSINELEN